MKKIIIVVTLLLAFSVTVILIGCSTNKPSTQNTTPQSNTTAQAPNKTFTADDLKKYTGQNGTPAYVAVNGTVYDVTNARKWRNGEHEQGIHAGVDLTSAMPNSPHGNSVLNGLPVVGTLK